MTDGFKNKSARTEQFALRISLIGYAAMAVLGIAFAWITGSEAILFDGVYSLISLVMVILAGRVARLVEIPGSDNFHFGFSHFEPMMNLFRGLLILVLGSFAIVSAIIALMNGGRPFNPGWAVFYGITAAVSCLVMSFTQRRFSHKVHSPTLEVDAKNWMVDGVISSAVGLTFLVALYLQRNGMEHIVPYVDPVMVILLVLAMAAIPVHTVWENLRELLWVAPDVSMQADVRERLNTALQDLEVAPQGLYIRMLKMGRRFYVMVHLVLPGDYPCSCAGDLDKVRIQLGRSLAEVHPNLTLDVIVTSDLEYAAGG